MLQTRAVFKARYLEVEQLKTHVDARAKIVRYTRIVNMTFDPGERTIIDNKAWSADPEGYFLSMNTPDTKLGCTTATSLVFEAGNRFQSYEHRSLDRVWIPGDWAYMNNAAFAPGSERGYEGENLIHTGTVGGMEQFWGFFSGIQDPMSEAGWKREIRSWGGGRGRPEWSDHARAQPPKIRYPLIGLERVGAE